MMMMSISREPKTGTTFWHSGVVFKLRVGRILTIHRTVEVSPMLKFILAVEASSENQAYLECAIDPFSLVTVHKSFTLYDKDIKRSMRFIKTLYYIVSNYSWTFFIFVKIHMLLRLAISIFS